MSNNGIPLVTSDQFPERIREAALRPLPQIAKEYDEPLTYRRTHTGFESLILEPSMIPFVTQFRVEKSMNGKRKVLITYPHINHNKMKYPVLAEISNNFQGDVVGCGFTDEPQIGTGMEITWYQWNKDDKLSGDDPTVYPMFNISESEDSPTIYARLTPKSENGETFEPEAFSMWLNRGGRDYLKIKATTKDGLRKIADANGLTEYLNEDFWEQPVHQIYWDLFWKVQMKGVKDGWSCAAEEGMHRFTSAITKFLCGFPDSQTGYLTLGSIKESDITNRECGTPRGIPDADFLKTWIDCAFDGKKPNGETVPPLDPLVLSVRFYWEPNLPAEQVAWASRAYSQCVMVSRKQSCNRSPLDIIGELMGNDVKVMDINQASRRADFTTNESPTHNPTESAQELGKRMYENCMDAEMAYPWTDLYNQESFTEYIDNPLNEDNQRAVREVLTFQCIPGHYHMLIREGLAEMERLDKNGTDELPVLKPPFLPSFHAMAKDVGSEFGLNSFMNPDIANGAYYGPIIITYLYAMYNNLLVHKVIGDPKRVLLIKYFLRFVNNANETTTRMEIHGSWQHLMELNHPNYFWECHNIEAVISGTRVILDIYNSMLSIGMEKVADVTWEGRRKHLNSIGNRFGTLMTKMGQGGLGVSGVDRLKVMALLEPLSFQLASSYFDHFAQHSRSQALGKGSASKVKKPWTRYIFYRNVMIELSEVLLAVGLFPNLASDYGNYSRGLDVLRESVTTSRPDPKRAKMIAYIGNVLKRKYNPMQPDAKPQQTTPRHLKFINMILGGKTATFPLAWLPVGYLYSLARFSNTQDTRKKKSLFKNRWFADNMTTKYDDCPRMIPSIRNGAIIEEINYFGQLQRKSSSGFDPCSFNDIAFIIYNTDGAAALPDIMEKKKLVDAWKKANPDKILLDASKEYKGTPRKSQPSKVAPMAAEQPSITRLPDEEESGEELGDIDDNEEDYESTEKMAMIQEIDWKTVNFEVPTTKIDQRKGAPPKLEQYQNILKLCRIRDISLWLVAKEDNDLQAKSEPGLDLLDLRERLKEWHLFKYKTSLAEKGVSRYQEQESKQIGVQPNGQAVQHSTTTTAAAMRATAKRVQPVSIAEMVNGMGDHRDAFLNKLRHNLNHVLHHASSIQRSLDSQSNSLMTANPPEALTVFNDAGTGLLGLRKNIASFATEFGLQKNNLIWEPACEPKVNRWNINSTRFGQKLSAQDLAAVINQTTKDGVATNFRIYDMRMLVDSMGWHQELKSVLDPNELVHRALMYGCSDISELAKEYRDSANKKKSTSNIGRLAGDLHELSRNGWAISLDKHDPMHCCFSLVTKDLDDYLSNWEPIQYEEDTPSKSPPEGEDSKSNAPSSITELRTPTTTQAAEQTHDLIPPVGETEKSDTPQTPVKQPADMQGENLSQPAAGINDASTTNRKRELSPSKEREINALKKAAGQSASCDKEGRRKKAARKLSGKYQREITKLEERFNKRKEDLEQLKKSEIRDRKIMCSMKNMKNSYGRGDVQEHRTEKKYNMYISLAEQQLIEDKDELIEEASAKHRKRKRDKTNNNV